MMFDWWKSYTDEIKAMSVVLYTVWARPTKRGFYVFEHYEEVQKAAISSSNLLVFVFINHNSSLILSPSHSSGSVWRDINTYIIHRAKPLWIPFWWCTVYEGRRCQPYSMSCRRQMIWMSKIISENLDPVTTYLKLRHKKYY